MTTKEDVADGFAEAWGALLAEQPIKYSFESQMAAAVRRMHKDTRTSLTVMASHGWYADPTWIAGAERYIADLLTERPRAEMDAELCDLIEEAAPASLSALEASFPRRARFFAAAFQAHARREYALSIPVLLAQADGICDEIHGVQLHSKKDGAFALAAKLDSATARPHLTPLLESHPISWNVGERRKRPGSLVLNRHTVLHGESVDYDTRANSCRAISYLRFVAWMLGPSTYEFFPHPSSAPSK
ncbi:MAG: hypothetical protein ABI488_23520 [Polyangiaceae bacterium]